MSVSFILKNPKAEKSAIYIRVSLRGTLYRRSTELMVEPKLWNANTQSPREVRGFTANRAIVTRLKAMREVAENLELEVKAAPTLPTPDEFWRRFYMRLDGVTKINMVFTDYMKLYAKRRLAASGENTAKQYRTAIKHLLAYESETHCTLQFADINLRFYERFRDFMLGKGYSLNFLGTVVKSIKVAYRDARDVDGLHDLHETEKRGFSSANFAAKTIYLSLDELQRIADLDITPQSFVAAYPNSANNAGVNIERKIKALEVVRNKFLLGAYTALRVSDFNYLRDVHIDGDYFRVTTQKTGAHVVIPIHPVIRRIIDSGFDISTPITDQKINEHIKEVARMAGITQLVEGTKYIQHRAVVGFFPKCDLITTHTARRSAATNMYKAGIPSISIMRITGHTTEKSFMKYIKITAEENAELMAKNKFFAG